MTSARHGRHAWLGLTPEVERFGPLLADRIAAALGEPAGELGEQRIADLIRAGDAGAWLALLRELTALVERGEAVGVADPERSILAGILRDQYRLAPGVLHLPPEDEARRERLERMLDRP